MRTRKPKSIGIICIILSAFCFALMGMFVALAGDLPSVQKSFFRNIVALLFALILLWKNKTSFRGIKGNLAPLLLRAVCGTTGILCNFYAVDHLLLSDASLLNKMSPFFAILFSFLLLKEKLTAFQGGIIFTAFLGSLLVIKPSFANADLGPALIGLCGGIAAGAAYTMVRKLGMRGVNSALIVFFFSAFSCLATLPFFLSGYQPMTGLQWLYLICAGLAASGGQFAITAAYTHAPAREISVYDYSQIIFSALLGFFVFGQVPDGWSFLGYCIIIFSAVLMYLRGKKKETPEAK